MKKVLQVGSWLLSVLALIVVVGFTESHLEQTAFSGLEITIDNRYGNFFVTHEELEEEVLNMGYAPDQVSLKAINIKELEDFLDRYPAVQKSQVFSSLEGKLHIHIRQRTPIVRVFSRNGDSYYLDDTGWLMPLSQTFTSRVMVANGEIDAPYHLYYPVCFAHDDSIDADQTGQRKLRDLYQVAQMIRKDPFWDAQINQVFVSESGDLELIPRVGDHRIIIGTADNLEDKLEKLRVFYIEGLNKTNWNDYTTINLKYNNQVVCTKKKRYGIN